MTLIDRFELCLSLTRTLSHTHTLSRSHTHSLSLTHTHSLSQTLSLTHYLSVSAVRGGAAPPRRAAPDADRPLRARLLPRLAHASLSLSLSFSLSLSHTHTHTLTHTLTHSHTHTLTQCAAVLLPPDELLMTLIDRFELASFLAFAPPTPPPGTPPPIAGQISLHLRNCKLVKSALAATRLQGCEVWSLGRKAQRARPGVWIVGVRELPPPPAERVTTLIDRFELSSFLGFVPPTQRESSLLKTYRSESTLSSRCFGGPASRHGSLNPIFQVSSRHMPPPPPPLAGRSSSCLSPPCSFPPASLLMKVEK